MKVFISWSGERSKLIALALRDWLPDVIQAVRPFMSENDIEAGSRSLSVIAERLQDSRVGILCLTPENLTKPWILFEAGALSKLLGESHVCPYLYELKKSEVAPPLGQFHAHNADRLGTQRIVEMVNNAVGEQGLSEVQLSRVFNHWWPVLEESLNAVPKEVRTTPVRTTEEMLEEILGSVRVAGRSVGVVDSPVTEPTSVRVTFNGGPLNGLTDNSDLRVRFDQFSGIAYDARSIYAITRQFTSREPFPMLLWDKWQRERPAPVLSVNSAIGEISASRELYSQFVEMYRVIDTTKKRWFHGERVVGVLIEAMIDHFSA